MSKHTGAGCFQQGKRSRKNEFPRPLEVPRSWSVLKDLGGVCGRIGTDLNFEIIELVE
jgi:hypothetical protein